jgi:hypothetical protein
MLPLPAGKCENRTEKIPKIEAVRDKILLLIQGCLLNLEHVHSILFVPAPYGNDSEKPPHPAFGGSARSRPSDCRRASGIR